jgi:hypothetical protein
MYNIPTILTGLFIAVTSGYGQTARRGNVSLDPCPGGTAIKMLETITPPTLEALVQSVDLIAVGKVVKVLPATRRDPHRLSSVETTSIISVSEVLLGSLARGTNMISISQLGGRVEPCAAVVPEDPLFESGDEYVLFLVPDERTVPPNTTGLPRYGTFGGWNGKAKVTQGRIQFLPDASEGLHKYDHSDVIEFIALLRDRINILSPKKIP